ncbi:MAG: GDP-L-fucose synthase [Candidatus Omnitrophica bacterium]|nr:GDP-L-fucose synthase [Candidatus Omnitrophota bacterium]
MEKQAKIYIAGHTGLLGTALVKLLNSKGYTNILTKDSTALDLRNQFLVSDFFKEETPDYVILAAGRVGGIEANIKYPGQFLYDNISISTNVIHSAYESGVKKLLFLASACAYPRNCPQPIKESYLFSGKLEPTNQAYAVAKLAGIEMSAAYNKQYQTNFISAVLTNMYGVNDTFNREYSHVIPALLERFHQAKIKGLNSVSIWGSGSPEREFIFSDDAACACLFLMESYQSSEPINIGSGVSTSIKELVYTIQKVVGYEGTVAFDSSKPDGMPKKVLDISKIASLGFKTQTGLEQGIKIMYDWYRSRDV